MITRNPWARWSALAASPAIQIASVIAHNADGTSTVTALDGAATWRVAGTDVAIGEYALIAEGRILETAADLPTATVEV